MKGLLGGFGLYVFEGYHPPDGRVIDCEPALRILRYFWRSWSMIKSSGCASVTWEAGDNDFGVWIAKHLCYVGCKRAGFVHV